ncbi:hypothetical protein Ciccas_002105 [Cichlidogyrus casuarinus]|uniref:2-phosphoxylose phosphatase 1 n=1 Tax=Cichlidogyrus casuarinus TaxID=1844966 RepID=A0ABD2QI89_9PLAT
MWPSLLLLIAIAIKADKVVFLIARHGSRSPCAFFKKDPFIDNWERSPCQLLASGGEEHIALGNFVRNHYKFLPSTFSHDSYFFRSSDTFRTQESAQYFIDGFFKQPKIKIPIASNFKEYDLLLKMSGKCPKYKYLLVRKLLQLYNEYKIPEFLSACKEFEEHGGIDCPDADPIDQLIITLKYCDPILIWHAQNLTNVPAWATQLHSTCKTLNNFKHTEFFSGSEINKIRGGPLTVHIIQMFLCMTKSPFCLNGFIQETWNRLPYQKPSDLKNSDKLKFIGYFAHDSTISALLSHMGVFNK